MGNSVRTLHASHLVRAPVAAAAQLWVLLCPWRFASADFVLQVPTADDCTRGHHQVRQLPTALLNRRLCARFDACLIAFTRPLHGCRQSSVGAIATVWHNC
jgi:hypothetical protein